MKRTKFETLVNLYLDKEISSSGLRWLNEELKADAERRNFFKQYWRLHKASRLALLRDFPSLPLDIGPSPAATPSMGKWRIYTYAVSGLAACFAVAAILYFPPPSKMDTPLPAYLPAAKTVVAVTQDKQPVRELQPTTGNQRFIRDKFSLTTDLLPRQNDWERFFNHPEFEFVDYPEHPNLEEIWPQRSQFFERENSYNTWPELRSTTFPVRDSRDLAFQFEQAGLRFGR